MVSKKSWRKRGCAWCWCKPTATFSLAKHWAPYLTPEKTVRQNKSDLAYLGMNLISEIEAPDFVTVSPAPMYKTWYTFLRWVFFDIIARAGRTFKIHRTGRLCLYWIRRLRVCSKRCFLPKNNGPPSALSKYILGFYCITVKNLHRGRSMRWRTQVKKRLTKLNANRRSCLNSDLISLYRFDRNRLENLLIGFFCIDYIMPRQHRRILIKSSLITVVPPSSNLQNI